MSYLVNSASWLLLLLALVLSVSCSRSPDAEQSSLAQGKVTSIFVRDYSPTLGNENAKVQLVEFFDPACETCAAFAPFVKKMMAANPGKIRLVLRYAPFHTGSDYFVKILEASKKQGKYWETLDALFKSQPVWASHHKLQPDKVWPLLTRAGLDIEQTRRDMNDPAIARIIAQDLADAKMLKVSKTPGFFANGKPLQKFGYQQLQALIESELRANYSE